MTSRRRTMSNQLWNNVAYVNVEIYNVEQRQINIVYFSVDINNVRQRRDKAVIFKVEFYNVDQHLGNFMNMTIFKNLKSKKIFLSFQKKKMTHLINNTCFWLWSINKKLKHRTYNLKINVGTYNAWYMKRIWK